MAEEYATVKFNAENNKLRVAKMCLLTSDSIGAAKAEFVTKTTDWDNTVKIASFRTGEKQYVEAIDANGACFIPDQVLTDEGNLYVGLFGIGENYRITTNYVRLRVFEGSYDEELDDVDIDEQLFQMVMSELSGKVDKITTIAGIPLKTDISRDELVEALNIGSGGGSGGEGIEQVNADWNATTGVAKILNKPTKLSQFEDDLGSMPNHTHQQYLTKHQDISQKADISFVNDGLRKKANLDHDHDDKYQPIGTYITMEVDPTVPQWAKEPQKPTYTYDEIQGKPPEVDLSRYATKNYVDDAIDNLEIEVDTELNLTSTNPIQNKAVAGGIKALADVTTFSYDTETMAEMINYKHNLITGSLYIMSHGMDVIVDINDSLEPTLTLKKGDMYRAISDREVIYISSLLDTNLDAYATSVYVDNAIAEAQLGLDPNDEFIIDGGGA